MEKVIRDGKVAIVYSPGYGAGWFSWHGIEQLVYDPKIVDMVEREEDPDNIVKHCHEVHSESHYYGGAGQLAIYWLDEGTEFYIDEYDGAECVVTKNDIGWMTA